MKTPVVNDRLYYHYRDFKYLFSACFAKKNLFDGLFRSIKSIKNPSTNSYSMIVAEASNEADLGHGISNEFSNNQISDDEIEEFLQESVLKKT